MFTLWMMDALTPGMVALSLFVIFLMTNKGGQNESDRSHHGGTFLSATL